MWGSKFERALHRIFEEVIINMKKRSTVRVDVLIAAGRVRLGFPGKSDVIKTLKRFCELRNLPAFRSKFSIDELDERIQVHQVLARELEGYPGVAEMLTQLNSNLPLLIARYQSRESGV